VGRDDDNEGFVEWALPTVFPVFMRLSWWAEPTLLLKTYGDDAYVGQQWDAMLYDFDQYARLVKEYSLRPL
jgi:hypothetical protein